MDIGLIGTGNVAYHLVHRLISQGLEPTTIYGRDMLKLQQFRDELNLNCELSLASIVKNHHLLILAVNDDAISICLTHYQFSIESILVHTSGSVSMEVFPEGSKHGVLYPLQTFSKSKPVAFEALSLFVEGNSEEVIHQIADFARLLTARVNVLNSDQRLKLHLVAVFACNFTNYLLHAAESILKGTDLGLSDLSHLIHETVEKALSIGPENAQTGPAIRGDEKTMTKHLALIEENAELREIYSVISRQISAMRQ